MTETRRELIFGVLGLSVLAVVAIVLFTQATDGDANGPAVGAGSSSSTAAAGPVTPPPPTPIPTPVATPTPTPNPQTYTVQPGDTLLGIAERFNITVEDLAARNDILDPNNVFAGQKLELPQPGERVGPAAGSGANGDLSIYVVQPGDTLFAISQDLGVSVEDLAELNEITDPTQLFVGRRLEVPPRRLTPPPRPTP